MIPKLLSLMPKRVLSRSYCSFNQSNLFFHPGFDPGNVDKFAKSFLLFENIVTENEEEIFMKEMEPHLKRHLYEKDHWDDAIQGFRETERKFFNKENSQIVERIKSKSFPSEGKDSKTLPYTHVLDLAETGFIKPHIDSSRFCGSTVAVLSLLSPCVARFKLDKDKGQVVDALVDRRSLYVMKDFSRYDFTHEILSNDESFFKENFVKKDRRISVICRNEA